MDEVKIDYEKDYAEFMSAYAQGVTSGEEAGALIARLAQAYAQCNIFLAKRANAFNKVFAVMVNTLDNGKPISVSKAEILVKTTPEYEVFHLQEVELKNIEMYINSIKSLQKGILNEYSHMGNS